MSEKIDIEEKNGRKFQEDKIDRNHCKTLKRIRFG